MVQLRPIHNQSGLVSKTREYEEDLADEEHGLVIGVDEPAYKDANTDN